MTLSSHKRKWRGCTRCPLHHTRCNTVLYRGACPCQVLFIGEAPGESEDIIGKPFVGPAGDLLNELLDPIEPYVEYGITNVICCIPSFHEEGKIGIRAPNKHEMQACSPRLTEIIKLADPLLIVTLGQIAAKHIAPLHTKIETEAYLELTHPSAILRKQQNNEHTPETELMVKRFQSSLLARLREMDLIPDEL